jgi:hypothetical protein
VWRCGWCGWCLTRRGARRREPCVRSHRCGPPPPNSTRAGGEGTGRPAMPPPGGPLDPRGRGGDGVRGPRRLSAGASGEGGGDGRNNPGHDDRGQSGQDTPCPGPHAVPRVPLGEGYRSFDPFCRYLRSSGDERLRGAEAPPVCGVVRRPISPKERPLAQPATPRGHPPGGVGRHSADAAQHRSALGRRGECR